jgi:hypothetical protein
MEKFPVKLRFEGVCKGEKVPWNEHIDWKWLNIVLDVAVIVRGWRVIVR